MEKFMEIKCNKKLGGDKMGTTTHIQTEVDKETHNVLKMLAMLTGRSLKEIAREALTKYALENKRKVEEALKNDPVWKTIGVLELEEDASERDDWGIVEWRSQ